MSLRGIRRAAAAGIAAAMLGGCVAALAPHPVVRESDEIGSQPVCCATFRDMPYVTLPAAQKRTFQIDPLSPIYAFKDGRSRFVAIQLPSAPAALRVRTNVITAWVEETTFDPFVTFLDGNFQSLGENVPAMRASSDALSRFREATVRVPSQAAYAVIYTKPSVYLRRRHENPIPLTPGVQPMSLHTNGFPVTAGPRGELVLEVLGR